MVGLLGAYQHQLELALQNVPYRLPVNPGRLHRRRLQPASRSQPPISRSPRVVVANRGTSRRTSPRSRTRTHPTAVSLCTSNPAHRSWVSAFDLISTPLVVKMSQKPSLPQSLHSVQLVLTGNSFANLRENRQFGNGPTLGYTNYCESDAIRRIRFLNGSGFPKMSKLERFDWGIV